MGKERESEKERNFIAWTFMNSEHHNLQHIRISHSYYSILNVGNLQIVLIYRYKSKIENLIVTSTTFPPHLESEELFASQSCDCNFSFWGLCFSRQFSNYLFVTTFLNIFKKLFQFLWLFGYLKITLSTEKWLAWTPMVTSIFEHYVRKCFLWNVHTLDSNRMESYF